MKGLRYGKSLERARLPSGVTSRAVLWQVDWWRGCWGLATVVLVRHQSAGGLPGGDVMLRDTKRHIVTVTK